MLKKRGLFDHEHSRVPTIYDLAERDETLFNFHVEGVRMDAWRAMAMKDSMMQVRMLGITC